MSRKDKHDDVQPNETQEPWEQPIYDTEYDQSSSRSQQRKKKRGTSKFLIILVVLLALCIALPTAAYFL